MYINVVSLNLSTNKRLKMPSKNVTLKIDSKIYDEYRKFCKEEGIIVFKQIEKFN